MILKTLTTAALLIAPVAANARDWRVVGLATDRTNALFVDADAIQRGFQPYPRVGLLLVNAATQNGYAAFDVVIEIDCVQHRRRGIEARGLDADGSIKARAGVELQWNDTPPSTLFSAAERAVCDAGFSLPAKSYGSGAPIAEARALLAD